MQAGDDGQAMYELYGASVAGKMLTALGRLFIKYIQFRGFTCRIDDLLLTVAYNTLARADMKIVWALTRSRPCDCGRRFLCRNAVTSSARTCCVASMRLARLSLPSLSTYQLRRPRTVRLGH